MLLFALLLGCPESPPTETAVPADITPVDAEVDEKGVRTWWHTCGDPVCRGWTRDRSVPLCTTQHEGDVCRRAGGECDIRFDGCNTHMVCATTDPTADGCPISLKAYKHDIRYLSDAEVEGVRDALMDVPLATWQYNADGAAAPTHLGFIIDDLGESPAVAESGDHVDLYGYTSMTVAALQAQQKQIDALSAQVKALQQALEAERAHKGR